jgi:xanthine dehydrogenase small subunit
VKEGCAEGDCGACTVVLGKLGNDNRIHYKAVNSCLVFLPMLHGKQLITVENLRSPQGDLHPVQQAMVELSGSQCGFCTPGIIMSLFALYKNTNHPAKSDIENELAGNLCRCTGYASIVKAAEQACTKEGDDQFTKREPSTVQLLKNINGESICIDTEKQKYFQPKKLDEVLLLRSEYPDATIVCGASDVALRVTKKYETLATIIDLSAVSELQSIREDALGLHIGASYVLNDIIPILKHDFKALHYVISLFGSSQIRNLATLAGNLATASPIGDIAPILMAYNSKIVAQSKQGQRTIDLDDFITGYRKTTLQSDEIITEVQIPKTSDQVKVKFYKISKRRDVDISSVNAAFRLELNGNGKIKNIKLVYGAMAESTQRAKRVEQFLIGKSWTRAIVEEAASILEKDFTPISDVRFSAEGRMIAAKNLLVKFWVDTESTSFDSLSLSKREGASP